MKFFPSLCADRGPVAETEVGTVGNGRGGTSLFILCIRFVGNELELETGIVAFPFCLEEVEFLEPPPSLLLGR